MNVFILEYFGLGGLLGGLALYIKKTCQKSVTDHPVIQEQPAPPMPRKTPGNSRPY